MGDDLRRLKTERRLERSLLAERCADSEALSRFVYVARQAARGWPVRDKRCYLKLLQWLTSSPRAPMLRKMADRDRGAGPLAEGLLVILRPGRLGYVLVMKPDPGEIQGVRIPR